MIKKIFEKGTNAKKKSTRDADRILYSFDSNCYSSNLFVALTRF